LVSKKETTPVVKIFVFISMSKFAVSLKKKHNLTALNNTTKFETMLINLSVSHVYKTLLRPWKEIKCNFF